MKSEERKRLQHELVRLQDQLSLNANRRTLVSAELLELGHERQRLEQRRAATCNELLQLNKTARR